MKKILVVEDDMPTLKLYNTKLQKEGFEVLSAMTGPDVFTVLAQQGPVDLILLDIMLPGSMNGFDILKKLKEEEPSKNIPVIMLTNLDTERESALGSGAVEYVVKANTPLNEIVEKVRKYT